MRVFFLASALFFAQACTNGMMGESAVGMSYLSSSSAGSFVDEGSTLLLTETAIEGTVVGAFKPYDATAASAQFGVVVSFEAALKAKIGETALTDYLSRASSETEVAEMKIRVNLPAYASSVVFPFGKIVDADGNLKNTIVVHPGMQVVFARQPYLPDTGSVIQTADQDLIVIGGKKNGFAVNQMILIALAGDYSLPNSSNTSWGMSGTLYIRDESPTLVSYRFGSPIYDALVSDIANNVIAKPAEYDSLLNPVNLIIVQHRAGATRTKENILEVRLMVFPASGTTPVPYTWCNSTHLATSAAYVPFGCTPERLTLVQSAIDAQQAQQGIAPTNGTLGSSATSGVTIEGI